MSLKPGFYALENVAGGTVLELSNDGKGVIQGYDFHGCANQQWRVEKKQEYWTFQNVLGAADKQYYLDVRPVKAGTALRATKVLLAWQIIEKDPAESIYQIIYQGKDLSAELVGGSSANKTPVNPEDNLDQREGYWKFYSLPIHQAFKGVDGRVEEIAEGSTPNQATCSCPCT